jgi:hypothetical protein
MCTEALCRPLVSRSSSMTDRRLANLRAALGFLQLPPREPELQLLHRWLDSWTGVGLITVGVERQGHRLSLSHIGEGEWRARFGGHPLLSDAGYGIAATPWKAVQLAAGAAVKRAPEGP